MADKTLLIGSIPLGNHLPFVLFGGLNVLEDEALTLEVAQHFKNVCVELNIPLVFKASFDKANRSSIHSFRGPGLDKGLKILQAVKDQLKLPVITDVHEPFQAQAVGEVCDVVQIPAFLARQTDLIQAVAKTNRVINVKKPQFLAPREMGHILKKCQESGNDRVIFCERGSSFGYGNLVVDMLGFEVMKDLGQPVMFDVTHSLQRPGGLADSAGGRRESVTPLARAGLAMGIAGLFLEAYPEPSQAKCDGPSALRLSLLKDFLGHMKSIDELVKGLPPLDTK